MAKYTKSAFRGMKAAWNLRKTIPLVVHLLLDKRVAKHNKIFFGIVTMGYLVFPYDFIFDFPFWGQIDDLAIFIFMIHWLIKRVPKSILKEYGWEPEEA